MPALVISLPSSAHSSLMLLVSSLQLGGSHVEGHSSVSWVILNLRSNRGHLSVSVSRVPKKWQRTFLRCLCGRASHCLAVRPAAREAACVVVQATAGSLSSVPCVVPGSLKVIAGTSVHAKADEFSNLLSNT